MLNSRLVSFAARLGATAVLAISIPSNVVAEGVKHAEAKRAQYIKEVGVSRALSATEMAKLRGKTTYYAPNPYWAGSPKFDVDWNGISVLSGNYSQSVTDLSFEEGFGVPVAMTRVYSANAFDETGLGYGWSPTIDARTTVGGLLTSASGPSLSTPQTMMDQHSSEVDPNSPFAAAPATVVSEDASGEKTTHQRDLDGVITSPPWDKNLYKPDYEIQTDGGVTKYILKSNQTLTPDGTEMTYEPLGVYAGGMVPWDQPFATPEPGYVLMLKTVKDRQGNVTTYNYSSDSVTFATANGSLSTKKLTSVQMPNNRVITLTWGNGTNAPTNRIKSVTDGTRTVQYGYTNGYLTSVTTPGGYTTEYGYGAPTKHSTQADDADVWRDVLTSIEDPTGGVTTIAYTLGHAPFTSTTSNWNTVKAYKITLPSGIQYRAYPHYNLFGDSTHDTDMTGSGLQGFTTYSAPVGGVRTVSTAVQVSVGQIPSTTFDGVDDPIIVSVSNSNGTNFVPPGIYKAFDPETYDCIVEWSVDAWANGVESVPNTGIRKYTKNNFLGQPLVEEVKEVVSGSTVRTTTTEHAYWGQDKYFQRKASRVSMGNYGGGGSYRYTFTDYYNSSASAGSRGQTKEVYDSKHGGIVLDSSNPKPAGVGTPAHWRYEVELSGSSVPSGLFEYDSVGRPNKVKKLQKFVNGSPVYNETRSTYYGITGGYYGEAASVTEAFGAPEARTTTSDAFDAAGRVTKVTDADGEVKQTLYDLDGRVLAIQEKQGNNFVDVFEYIYGSSGASKGQPVQIVSHQLDGVTQDITYGTSGVTYGMPYQVTTTTERDSYSHQVTYQFNEHGDRTAALHNSNGERYGYQYSDFTTVGRSMDVSRVFQTMERLNWNGSAYVTTNEKHNYDFSVDGKLLEATFAHQRNSSGDVIRQARAVYSYDVANRVKAIEYYWDAFDNFGTLTSSEKVFKSDAEYNHPLGLKTQMGFRENNGSNGWSTGRTEFYGYDAKTDYLLNVDYNDGLNFEVQSWTYDAAGNRMTDSMRGNEWQYDLHNRLIGHQFMVYSYSKKGERINDLDEEEGIENAYVWRLGQLEYIQSSNNGETEVTNQYRADGMRVWRQTVTSSSTLETRSDYDGQMPVYEQQTSGGNPVWKRWNALGARGIDAYYNSTSSSWLYPLYDVHGNVKATLTRSGATGYSTANWKSFDVWGGERSSTGSGSMFGYGGNLGHPTDPENGLIYMRARFYEPWTGRFLSEDPFADGLNWYIYCGSDPVNYLDLDGLARIHLGQYWIYWQKHDKDLAWGDRSGQQGQLKRNGGGKLKHPEFEKPMPEKLKKLLRNSKNPDVQKVLGKAGNIGLGLVGYTSLDVAFLRDPFWFGDLVDEAGGEWWLLKGEVIVEGV